METLSFLITPLLLIVCASFSLVACATCKRIFKKKQKDPQQDEVSVENGETKETNGIANPVYGPGTNFKKESDITTRSVELKDEKDNNQKNIQECNKGTTESDGNSSSPFMNKTPQIQSPTHSTISTDMTSSESAKARSTISNKEVHATSTTQETTKILDVRSSIEEENQHEALGVAKSFSKTTQQQDSAKHGDESGSSDSNYQDALLRAHGNSFKERKELSNDSSHENDSQLYDGLTLSNGWGLSVKLKDLFDLGLIDSKTADDMKVFLNTSGGELEESEAYSEIKPFLFGKDPIAGLIYSDSGEKKSISQSAKEGVLRRATAISLLEAQAATGNILDPLTGRKFSVAEGREINLYDRVYEMVISRAERAVTGYRTRITQETLSFGEAITRGFVLESHGLKLLEVQLATGGLIDYRINVRLPLDTALKRKLVDEQCARKLAFLCGDTSDEQKNKHFNSFNDPNTQESVTYRELMRRCVRDDDTGMLLYPLLRKKSPRPRYGRSSLMSSRRGSFENLSSLSLSS